VSGKDRRPRSRTKQAPFPSPPAPGKIKLTIGLILARDALDQLLPHNAAHDGTDGRKLGSSLGVLDELEYAFLVGATFGALQ
jgi:hypothetical protein